MSKVTNNYMDFVLFDDRSWGTLRPLTLTRPVGESRVGILTIREKWERRLAASASWLTQEHLREKYPLKKSEWWINGSICPDDTLAWAVSRLRRGELLEGEGVVIAFRVDKKQIPAGGEWDLSLFSSIPYVDGYTRIEYPYHIFGYNHRELLLDFDLLTRGRESQKCNESVRVHGTHPLFVEEGAVVESAVINTNKGPVYIGRGAEVMEGVVIRGPLALCDHAVLKVGAKVYGATTIGPYCKCGGELNNVVLMGYSNKAHDGFLGNSVLGEWCNIGAGTNVSNLKNNYAEVKLWDYESSHFRKTGLQFCGLIMGDHSKMGIGMTINTGTVVGIGANLYGTDFPRNFIPSFTWGSSAGFTRHKWTQFEETARLVMRRREKVFDEKEQRLLEYLYQDTVEVK